MPRTFRSGIEALNALLDAADAHPNRVRPPSAKLDHNGMTAAELDAAYELFDRAEKAGAIVIRYEKGGLASRRASGVVLANAESLARLLGRPRAGLSAARQIEALTIGLWDLPDSLKPALGLIESAWARGKVWHRLEPGDIEAARQCFLLASALLARDSDLVIDERTFSGRSCGSTKALERRRNAVLAILTETSAVPSGMTLEFFGIVPFPDHIHLRGPLLLELPVGSIRLDFFNPSAAIPPEQAHMVRLLSRPPYLMTIENKASFQRYVRTIKDGSLVLFTSGFVSDVAAGLLQQVVTPSLPWFHWGDIDAGGLAIFRWLEENIAVPAGAILRPHLMTSDLALANGKPIKARDSRLSKIMQSHSAIADLARWLIQARDARTLEQEVLDPLPPNFC